MRVLQAQTRVFFTKLLVLMRFRPSDHDEADKASYRLEGSSLLTIQTEDLARMIADTIATPKRFENLEEMLEVKQDVVLG